MAMVMNIEEEEVAVQSKIGQQVCCECGVDIDSAINPTSTCISCLRARVDITDGIARSGSVHKCRRCERYQTGVKSWMKMDLESKELMELCMKKIKGLRRVVVSDAAWVWTEPHSMRLKVRLTVQKEVYNGAVLQQLIGVEFVVRNLQCLDCQQMFASMAWKASVQLRQRVEHKRTFFYLEQIILKTNAQRRAIKIEQFKDGLDFFFKDRSDSLRFIGYLQNEVPTRAKQTRKLVTSDLNSNIFTHQHTSYIEIAPACKDDLILVSARTARNLGDLPRVLLVRAVNSEVRLVDPKTARIAELTAEKYWRDEPVVMVNARQLETFVVLDVEPVEPFVSTKKPQQPTKKKNKRKQNKKKRAHDSSDDEEEAESVMGSVVGEDDEAKKRRRAATSRAAALPGVQRMSRGFVADVTLARKSDLGVNDQQVVVPTHLGAILRAGDEVLGYDIRGANMSSYAEVDARELPEIVLVRKAPQTSAASGSATADRHKRVWKLRSLDVTEVDEGFKESKAAMLNRERDYELFLQQLESDKEMRSKIALFKINEDELKIEEEEEEDEDDDALLDPEAIALDELLEDIKIEDDEKDALKEEEDNEGQNDEKEDPEAPFESYENEDF